MAIHFHFRLFDESDVDCDKSMLKNWVTSYSRLKFGDNEVAKHFGWEMAEQFFIEHYDFFNKQVVVIAAPSSATVPAASTLLAHHMMERFNMLCIKNSLPLVEWTPIHRITTYYDNYAGLPKEERERLLSQDKIFINKDFIKDKNLIFVDDCNITGTHEKKIEDFLVGENIDNHRAYVCYARYNGGNDASIEKRLNHTEIADAIDLTKMVQEMWGSSESFIWTTRAIRMILEHPKNDFSSMLDRLTFKDRSAVIHAAIAKAYHMHDDYKENFESLMASTYVD